MRAPFQILAIPYRIIDNTPFFCAFRRTDSEYWQFVAGGGENDETPIEAAKREIFEESGVKIDDIMQLTCIAYVPSEVIDEYHRQHWDKDIYVIPEYAFAFKCDSEPIITHEHTEYRWLPYDEARKLLKWDSNKVAMYELNCRLEA